ncbi:MAG: hypothetical protein [Bacteriophage sp.]|nr:MAG: hypothetical protein [Bacteriophage sp.]UVX84047.1 MAG: hypothetical protein [Bacteriophage sp.]UWI15974.1 MAG: hypothetical protein [Bacteriophage sp.]
MKRIIETTEGEIVIGELSDLVDFVPTYNVLSLDERLQKRLDEKVRENMKKKGITFENFQESTWIEFDLSYKGYGVQRVEIFKTLFDDEKNKEVDVSLKVTLADGELPEVNMAMSNVVQQYFFGNVGLFVENNLPRE